MSMKDYPRQIIISVLSGLIVYILLWRLSLDVYKIILCVIFALIYTHIVKLYFLIPERKQHKSDIKKLSQEHESEKNNLQNEIAQMNEQKTAETDEEKKIQVKIEKFKNTTAKLGPLFKTDTEINFHNAFSEILSLSAMDKVNKDHANLFLFNIKLLNERHDFLQNIIRNEKCTLERMVAFL